MVIAAKRLEEFYAWKVDLLTSDVAPGREPNEVFALAPKWNAQRTTNLGSIVEAAIIQTPQDTTTTAKLMSDKQIKCKAFMYRAWARFSGA